MQAIQTVVSGNIFNLFWLMGSSHWLHRPKSSWCNRFNAFCSRPSLVSAWCKLASLMLFVLIASIRVSRPMDGSGDIGWVTSFKRLMSSCSFSIWSLITDSYCFFMGALIFFLTSGCLDMPNGVRVCPNYCGDSLSPVCCITPRDLLFSDFRFFLFLFLLDVRTPRIHNKTLP